MQEKNEPIAKLARLQCQTSLQYEILKYIMLAYIL